MMPEAPIWIDGPKKPVIVMKDPPPIEEAFFMPFPKPIRDWWMRVAEGKDQTMIYTEEKGWHQSSQKAEEVDHLTPESEMIYQGKNPDTSVAVPRSKQHHVGKGRDENGEIAPFGHPAWSRHPDIAEADEAYRKGDKEAFKEAIKRHREMVARGEVFTNDDAGMRRYEEEKMLEKATRYLAKHPNDPLPVVHHKEKALPIHFTHNWWDGLFSKNGENVTVFDANEQKGHYEKDGIELKWIPDD